MGMRRLATAIIGGVLLLALSANFLASDRPILLSYQDQLFFFPNLIDYHELDGLAGDRLRQQMSRDDWAIWPPVRHSPTGVRSGGELNPLAPPSSGHLLGTDDRGRDVLARLIHGSRATLVMGLGAAALALVLGLGLALAGVAGGGRSRAAPVVIAICDTISAIPALLLVVGAQGLTGRITLGFAILLVAIPRAADTARIALASLQSALAEPYCEAARALGGSPARVLFRHALPQAVPQLLVAAAVTASIAVLAEASLSFLGFGTPPPAASWGELLKQAHQNGLRWWLMLPPGIAVALVAGALGAVAQPRSARLAATR